MTTFEKRLSLSLRKLVKQLKNDGTIAMSFDCLCQNAWHLPQVYGFSGVDGAPRGTNAGYYFRECMKTAVLADTTLRRFVRGLQ